MKAKKSTKPKANRHVAKGGARKFDATLERMPGSPGWTVVHIPFSVAEAWGVRGQVRVKGTVNGFAFGTSLFPAGQGRHLLLVNKKMQKGGRTTIGMTAAFRIESDTSERKIEPPPQLTAAIGQDRQLRKYFDGLSPSMRAELAKYTGEPKSAEARTRRAEQIAERLMTSMLAERGELPPMLQAALLRNPKAKRGWDLMPPAKRRFHLMGIAGYKSPESRQKRLAKTIAEAMHYADRAERRGR